VDPPEGKEIMTHKEAAKFPIVSYTFCRMGSHMVSVQQPCRSCPKRGGRRWELVNLGRHTVLSWNQSLSSSLTQSPTQDCVAVKVY
jgi:hypothetical protein